MEERQLSPLFYRHMLKTDKFVKGRGGVLLSYIYIKIRTIYSVYMGLLLND